MPTPRYPPQQAGKMAAARVGENIFDAASENSVEELTVLCKGWAGNAIIDACRDEDGLTALHSAIAHGHEEAVRVLVAAGANVNATCTNGWTTCHVAVANGHASIAQIMINEGVDIDAVDKTGYTALHLAAGKGHASIIRILIQEGIDISLLSSKGNSALQIAKSKKKDDCVALLEAAVAAPRVAKMKRIAALPLPPDSNQAAIDRAIQETMEREKALEAAAQVEALFDGTAPKGYRFPFASNDIDSGSGSSSSSSSRGRRSSIFGVMMSPSRSVAEQIFDAVIENNIDELIVLSQKYAGSKAIDGHLGRYGETALQAAAERGNEDCVRLLVAANARIEAGNDNGDTALHLASSAGHALVCHYLMEEGADKMARNKHGKTPFGVVECQEILDEEAQAQAFYEAATNNELDKLVALCQIRTSAAVLDKHKDEQGMCAMHVVAARGNVDIMKTLIGAGSNVNIANLYGCTALHIAVSESQVKACTLLLKNKALVDAVTSDGKSALHYAAGLSDDEDATMCRTLLEFGARVDILDKNGFSALHVAAGKGLIAAVRTLVTAGSNLNAVNNTKKTPLGWALENEQSEVVAILEAAALSASHQLNKSKKAPASYGKRIFDAVKSNDLESVIRLTKGYAGNSVIDEFKDPLGCTALLVAARLGLEEVVLVLIAAAADVHALDANSAGVVHNSAREGHEATCLLFLEDESIDVNALDASGLSPLHLAVQNNHLDCVKLLLDKGADCCIEAPSVGTSLQIAIESEFEEIATLLKEKGAY